MVNKRAKGAKKTSNKKATQKAATNKAPKGLTAGQGLLKERLRPSDNVDEVMDQVDSLSSCYVEGVGAFHLQRVLPTAYVLTI